MLAVLGFVLIIAGLAFITFGERFDERQRRKDEHRIPVMQWHPDVFPSRVRGMFLVLLGVVTLVGAQFVK